MEKDFAYLLARGVKVHSMKADGNCLFRAFSDQTSPNGQEAHAEVRANVIRTMTDNPAQYLDSLQVEVGGGTRRNASRKSRPKVSAASLTKTVSVAKHWAVFYDYLEKMSLDGAWGGEMEIMAFARCYNVNVVIFLKDEDHKLYLPHEDGVLRPTVYIAYHSIGQHYFSIRNIGGPKTGLPLVNLASFWAEKKAADEEEVSAKENLNLSTLINMFGEKYTKILLATLRKCGGNVEKTVDAILNGQLLDSADTAVLEEKQKRLNKDERKELRQIRRKQNLGRVGQKLRAFGRAARRAQKNRKRQILCEKRAKEEKECESRTDRV